MDAAFTKAGLFRFLGIAERQGIYNANTLGGLRSAATKLLSDLDDNDSLQNFDAHASMMRYHNKNPGELRATVLGEYVRRMNRLLRYFEEYNRNPAGFRPRGRAPVGPTGGNNQRSSKSKPTKATKAATEEKRKEGSIIEGVATRLDSPTKMLKGPGPEQLGLSYPLRDDFLVQLLLPRDITLDEARRVGAFIQTLARDFKPT